MQVTSVYVCVCLIQCCVFVYVELSAVCVYVCYVDINLTVTESCIS